MGGLVRYGFVKREGAYRWGCGSYDNGMTVVVTAVDGMAEITVNRFYDDGIVEEDTKIVNRVPMGLVWENLPPEVYR